MGEAELVHALLVRAADEGGQFAPPPAGELQRGPSRSPRTLIAVAASVMIVVAVAVELPHGTARRHGTQIPRPLPQSGVSASALARYTWKSLPPAPIEGRAYPGAVWTGKEMIIWGGISGYAPTSVPEADGAAYDPATRAWRKLAPAPLSGRWEPATTWTAGKVIVWGGVTAPGKWSTDGATYNPETNRWQRMAPAPVQLAWGAQAFTIGKRMIVLSSPSEFQNAIVHADAYDPSSNTWTSLPDLKLPADQQAQDVVAVASASRLYVWTYWMHTVSQTTHSYSAIPGQTAWTLDPDARTWQAGVANPSGLHIQAIFWTGSRIVIPRQDPWCGACSHPMPTRADGIVIDPTTGASTPIAEGPLALAQSTPYLWTGAAVLELNNESSAGTATKPIVSPGDTAAWDPTTNQWIRLRRAPFVTGGAGAVIWTGHSAIVWSIPYKPKTAHQPGTGIELSP